MRPAWLLCWFAAIPVAALGQGMPASHKAAAPGASSCGGCHGLRPVAGQAVPPIAGRPASEIKEAMAAFQAGERPATIMTRIARGFSAEETSAIAAWLERQR
jgi:cytochrome c553